MSDGEVEVAILTTNELLNDVWGPAYRTKFEYVRVYNGDGMRVLVGDSEPGTRFGR